MIILFQGGTVKFFLVLLVTVFTSVFAQAGQETHGGDYVICKGRENVVLDYFQAQLPNFSGEAQLVDISQMSADQVIKYFIEKFSETLAYANFERYAKTVGNYKKWVIVENLVNQDDEDLPFIPVDCTLSQAAVRQNGVVYISRKAIADLSPAQIGILAVHESLAEMFTKFDNTIYSSAHVRKIIGEMLNIQTDLVTIAEVFDIYKKSSSHLCSEFTWYNHVVNGVPQYRGKAISFSQKYDIVSGLFDTESGEKIDILNPQHVIELLHFHPLENSNNPDAGSGSLRSRKFDPFNGIMDSDDIWANNISCNARNNECISRVDDSAHLNSQIAKKYGRMHLKLGFKSEMHFDQDPQNRVFVAEVKSNFDQSCANLIDMQRQSRGQLSR